jgi:hypothetical protein
MSGPTEIWECANKTKPVPLELLNDWPYPEEARSGEKVPGEEDVVFPEAFGH